ncbi:MAG: bifunctional tRNA (5-methylaminomethyl-2-thiouridine)(34)-methyltransferase MnmD/FAD-dependent 5-carboxymethylaminomethyl-2-thiouridine(34) oxidoreductase MnmC [Pseudomonadales bacterium]|nr:bifunctional tRNA (5-methylaminomethyl-2-thiouridine)(34)-methyltransferase MnmD/FAD-dependent 5-carboxymethylaminomethyl-2-thiouridine(34) oxidoreductase MnmC [Pseudomonadales bacterium]
MTQPPTNPKQTLPIRGKQGKNQHLAEAVTPATLNWKDDSTPVSDQFDDIYYSTENGLDETQYVFLHHNQLMERWRQLKDTANSVFTIAETGFGTGLNFLTVCAAWQQQPLCNARLHFISVEKFPLTQQDLQKALTAWPSLQSYANQLISHYPVLVKGYHRIEFPALRISLTLIFEDATTAYQQLTGKIDAWFLDGFAPSKNPQMWQPELYDAIKSLSHRGTTVATFTAAGAVRRGLESVGFSIEKHPGFGHKREMISGIYSAQADIQTTLPHSQSPWYKVAPQAFSAKRVKTAIVNGAGLAGTATARALAERGIETTLIEQGTAIAQGASGNPTGITFTKLSPFDNAQNRFYQKAYLYSIATIKQRFQASNLVPGEDYLLNGVLRFAFNEKEITEQQKLAESGLWPESLAQILSAPDCTDLIGYPCKHGGIFLTEGGWLTPADLCEINIQHPKIKLLLNRKVEQIAFCNANHKWQVRTLGSNQSQTDCNHNKDSNGKQLEADALIVANSFGANQLSGLEHLPLRSVRGQITYLPATPATAKLKFALNYEGYITPAKKGYHCIGATFHPKEQTRNFRTEDHTTNLKNLADTVPSLFQDLCGPEQTVPNIPIDSGRVAFRCQSPDYLPLIGPAPDIAAFKNDYANLRKGFLKLNFPLGTYLPNLYLNLAHGSRGITSSIFAAEIIASYINQEPQPIDSEVLEAIHPARFTIRALKRNQM